MPKISIVLPTYNVEKYISRALNSCINQTFSDIEIIVVDDCGNDKSIEIAKEFANHDERIKIIKNPQNLGTFETRNEGVRHSNGDFLMFLDPDDELELNACEVAYKAAVKNAENSYDMVIFKTFLNKNKSKKIFLDYEIFGEISKEILLKNINKIGWNVYTKLFKTNLVKNAIFNLKKELNQQQLKLNMAEDALLTFFIQKEAKNFMVIPDILYKYYINDSSITKTKDLQKQEEGLKQSLKVSSLIFKNIENQYEYIFFSHTITALFLSLNKLNTSNKLKNRLNIYYSNEVLELLSFSPTKIKQNQPKDTTSINPHISYITGILKSNLDYVTLNKLLKTLSCKDIAYATYVQYYFNLLVLDVKGRLWSDFYESFKIEKEIGFKENVMKYLRFFSKLYNFLMMKYHRKQFEGFLKK